MVVWWMNNEFERMKKESWPNFRHCPDICEEGLENHQKPVMIFSIPTGILPDTSQKCYHFRQLGWQQVSKRPRKLICERRFWRLVGLLYQVIVNGNYDEGLSIIWIMVFDNVMLYKFRYGYQNYEATCFLHQCTLQMQTAGTSQTLPSISQTT